MPQDASGRPAEEGPNESGLASPTRNAIWAVIAAVAWYVWLGVAGLLLGMLFRLVNSLGSHPDSDLIFFAGLYAASALCLMLVGYAGHRVIELIPLPFAPWKPGVLVVVAASLASISSRQSAVGRIVPSAVFGQILLPFVLAPAAVLVGMGVAAVRARTRDRRNATR